MSCSAVPARLEGEVPRKDSVHAQDGYTWHSDHTDELRKRRDMLEISTCASPGETFHRIRKVRRKDESLAGYIRHGIVTHQLGLSINCLLLLALTHTFFPSLRPTTSLFFSISHKDAASGLYNPGYDDLKIVATWTIVFTGLRAGTMDYVLMPWAQSLGVEKKRAQLRFAEQAWLLIYVSVFWSVGMYLYCTSSYYADLPAMWANFPTTAITASMKLYYLAQFAFWLQQIVVVHIEERRKDHWQMFTHHIITSLLIFFSYGYYQTKVGHVFLLIMDTVDLTFPTAKMLRYAGYQTACDILFGIFIVTWFVTRQVAYLTVCWSLYTDVPVVMPYGCYSPMTGQRLSIDGGNEVLRNVLHAYSGGNTPVCMNDRIRLSFLGLLLALQGLLLVWFSMICKVAYSVLSGKGADDSRSDDEEDEDVEDEVDAEQDVPMRSRQQSQREISPPPQPQPLPKAPIEEEVDVDELRFVRRSSPTIVKSKRRQGRASGISIPGHGDHKELLGRIGCDKPGS